MTQTGHPEELLAEYVDGTLDEHDRRAVEAHLASCTTCSDEVALAGGSRRMLRDLPEEPVPLGVTGPVLDETSRAGRRERAPRGQRIQWAAGVAVAAALVAVVAVSLPHGNDDAGTGGGDGATLAEAGDAATTPGAPEARYATFAVSLERSNRDFDDKALRGLAMEVAKAVRGATLQAPTEGGTPQETREARECVTALGAAEDEVLVRLLLAKYDGEPAYVAVYLKGPGVGEPPSRATVWVVSADGACEFLDITEVRI
jgi:Putative zinc-finger